MTHSEKFVWLGLVGKARGLQGEFFVSGRDEPWDQAVKEVSIGTPPRVYKIQHHRLANQRLIAKLSGVDTREQVEELRLQKIWCERSLIKVNHEQEYLWSDLVGVKVLDTNLEPVGTIQGFENFGAHDNICVSSEGRFLELPFISEYFDMSFAGRPEHVKLKRSLSDIEELWQESK
jgi:16S rRNA processing protein RimM